jgi:hypothetical protein
MIRRFCDRCGIDMPKKRKNKVVITFEKQLSIMDETVELDLCNCCEGELRRFLNGGEKKEC